MLTNGKAIIKPAKEGFFKDNQLAKDIIIPEIITLKTNRSTLVKLSKKVFNFRNWVSQWFVNPVNEFYMIR